MRQNGTVEVRPGSTVWWEGALWRVEAVHPHDVVLRLDTNVARVPFGNLIDGLRILDPGASEYGGDPLGSIALSSLSQSARASVEETARVITHLLEGDGPWGPRMDDAARELGVDVRTVRRRVAAFRERGVAGLVNATATQRRTPRVDPRWDAVCLDVLKQYTNKSTPTQGAVIDEVSRRVVAQHGRDVALPHRATAYRRLKELEKGRYTFGSAKARRSVAARPDGVLGRLRADRPGEYVVLDTNSLDVFAMEPVTGRWVPVQLTVAMDLMSRSVLGLRLTPVSTKAIDVANVLFQCLLPQSGSGQTWPYHGVPSNLLVGTEEPDGVHQERQGGLPAIVPDTIVTDHGKQYMSAHVIGACARLGICVQPAIPHKPTDKPTIERFFKTLRESLLQHLPGYKGPDVYSRGERVEQGAFYYVAELEQIIREWVATVYHHTEHDGLAIAEIPRARFTPAQMFEIGLTRIGGLMLPAARDLAFEFLDVKWRTIQHYGVEVNGLRYDGEALSPYRNLKSTYGGAYAGKWPLHVDVHDVRHVWFRDPGDDSWNELKWEHAPSLKAPFSLEAVEYAKRVALHGTHVDNPSAAVHELLAAWQRGEVTTRRHQSLARRLAAQPSHDVDGDARQIAALPGVINLLERRAARSQPADDLDVFERYEPVDEFEVLD
ncbi:helix-turn-helix domain-containing protein [Cellulomonas sp. KH9]|uniref:helix-turn-helix domain-containing protein n=1 Tax=Cellulomonas sp. KH9 TaxID=1855324 RepID=UPI0008E7C8E7|nr:helix-turn-helix domain-containing protein [Cellulomonas sp. KH9]SFK12526.1 Mu transposase, C-terminal [Cellulomonas sp. KH9]